jgi:predicted MFS family arabinose efflux permease
MLLTPSAPTRASIGLAAAGAALIAVCYGLARFAYGLFVPAFRVEFGLDAATAGAVASGSYGAYCVAIVVATVATARWGPRSVAVAAGVCATVGTAVIALAPGTAVLAVGVVLAGSSTGLASPPLAQAVARTAPSRLEPRLQTVVNAGTGLGVLVSGPVALLLAGHWRWAWAAFSVVALVVTLCAWTTVPGRPGPVTTRSSSSASALTASLLAPRGARSLLIAAGVMGLGSAAVWTFGRDLVGSAGGGDLTGVIVWIALGAAGLLGAFAGDLSTRIGLARCWSAAMVLLGGATALLALGADVPALAVATGAVFGAVYIGLSGLLLLWATRVHSDRPVFGVGAAFLVLALGQALGAPVLGVLADALTLPGAFLVAALVCALGALIRPRPGRTGHTRTGRATATVTANPTAASAQATASRT